MVRLLAVSVCCAFFAQSVSARNIDDYQVGGYSFETNGVVILGRVGSPEKCIGGYRRVQLWDGPTKFQMSPSFGLRIEQTGLYVPVGEGRFQYAINYGTNAPLNANLAANGHDRFRFKFDDGTANWTTGKLAMWVNSTATLPEGLGIGPSYNVVAGGGILEIPFSLFAANFADIDRITIAGLQLELGNYFVMRSVVTAGPPAPGDFDRDGDADVADLAELQRTFGRRTGTTNGFLSTDENRDGVVDGDDFLAWQRASQATPAATSVPEPASVLAAVMCVLAGPVFRRRKVSWE